jgi:membrane protease YdiL (CAAX protease family)
MNIKKAAIISSAIFGIVHIMNIVHSPVIETLALLVFAFGFGILFAAIYVRSANLWAVALLHGFFNFAAGAANILMPADVIAPNGIAEEIATQIPLVVVAILAACFGIFLLRRKKIAEGWH